MPQTPPKGLFEKSPFGILKNFYKGDFGRKGDVLGRFLSEYSNSSVPNGRSGTVASDQGPPRPCSLKDLGALPQTPPKGLFEKVPLESSKTFTRGYFGRKGNVLGQFLSEYSNSSVPHRRSGTAASDQGPPRPCSLYNVRKHVARCTPKKSHRTRHDTSKGRPFQSERSPF